MSTCYFQFILFFFIFFFFSSRRRHTRCLSDWSSDVCSSDLVTPSSSSARSKISGRGLRMPTSDEKTTASKQIGRASCRERVEISVVAGSLKKKKNKRKRQ